MPLQNTTTHTTSGMGAEVKNALQFAAATTQRQQEVQIDAVSNGAAQLTHKDMRRQIHFQTSPSSSLLHHLAERC